MIDSLYPPAPPKSLSQIPIANPKSLQRDTQALPSHVNLRLHITNGVSTTSQQSTYAEQVAGMEACVAAMINATATIKNRQSPPEAISVPKKEKFLPGFAEYDAAVGLCDSPDESRAASPAPVAVEPGTQTVGDVWTEEFYAEMLG